MKTAREQLIRPSRASTVASLGAATMVGLLTTSALAADGPQTAPTLTPSPVATAASNFELSNGSCDGTGGAGWRVQTFVVDTGVDIATLAFDQGPTADQVGTDRDSTDGTIQAPLYDGDATKTGFLPAASPPGLINPSDLGGFDFSSSGWVLADGTYEVGYACLDEFSVLRQWWSLTVTIDAEPATGAFMAVGAGSGTTTSTTGDGSTTSTTTGGGTTTTTTGGGTTTTTAGQGTTTTTAAGGTTTTVEAGPGATTSTTRGSGVLSAQASPGSGSSSLAATGQGLAAAGIALVLIYVGRVAYLLGQPRRTATRR